MENGTSISSSRLSQYAGPSPLTSLAVRIGNASMHLPAARRSLSASRCLSNSMTEMITASPIERTESVKRSKAEAGWRCIGLDLTKGYNVSPARLSTLTSTSVRSWPLLFGPRLTSGTGKDLPAIHPLYWVSSYGRHSVQLLFHQCPLFDLRAGGEAEPQLARVYVAHHGIWEGISKCHLVPALGRYQNRRWSQSPSLSGPRATRPATAQG